MQFSPAHISLLELLTWHVRLATDDQAREKLSLDGCDSDSAVRLLRQLTRAGLIHREQIDVGVFDLHEPICVWSPGCRPPNLGSVAWRLFVRAQQVHRRRMMVNWATLAAASLMGGVCGRLRQPLQTEHDLGTTAMHLASLQRDADLIWYGEDIIRRRFADRVKKIPDAVLVDRSENIVKVMEFGGQYSRRRLTQFQRCWRTTHWEIW